MNLTVIINGSGTAGKDTVVDIVDEKVYNTFIYNVSSIDRVRSAAEILGWRGCKSDNDREFLHQLKMISSKFYDHSFRYMFEQYEHYNKMCGNLLGKHLIGFFHIREPEEIEKFKNAIQSSGGRVLTLLIKRDNIDKFSNEADKNVENYQYDYVVENNGTIEELENNVIELFNEILKEK